jgi:hypothetical protein
MLDEMESYSIWIKQLKDKIQRAQLRASLSVNTQLILLYWEIGESIVQKQIENQWGSKIVEKMAKDLKMGMSETSGFSRSNLFAMRKFYLFYKESHLALISPTACWTIKKRKYFIWHTLGSSCFNFK